MRSFRPFGGYGCASASNFTELLLANSSQGYLGVGLRDVDTDRATALKLKDARGAEIVSIDQDAPAAKSSLRVHDVVVQMNGQRIESVEQFRRMLHDTPPGRTVTLVALREGQSVTINVQLADRAAIAYQSIEGLGSDAPLKSADGGSSSAIVLSSHGGSGHSSSFFGSLIRNRYYVGVELESLPTGLADYFGVRNGVLVGNVFPNSPAAAAGLKPADVIQKVNGRPIVSLADWEKAIKVNHGKQIQVTIIRDKKEQTLTMLAGEGKNSGGLEMPDTDFPEAQMLAELSANLKSLDPNALADQIRESMKGFDADQLRKQAEQAAKEAQTIDIKQMEKALEETRRQMQEYGPPLQQQMKDMMQSLKSLQLEQMD